MDTTRTEVSQLTQTTIRAISKIRRSPRETTTMMKVPKGVAKSMAFCQNSVPLEAWVVGLYFGVGTVVDAVRNQNK